MGKIFRFSVSVDARERLLMLLKEKLSSFVGKPLNDETNAELRKAVGEWVDEVLRSVTVSIAEDEIK